TRVVERGQAQRQAAAQGRGVTATSCQSALFMNASTATVYTPLRQAWPRFVCGQAGRLALRDLNILFQVCLGLLGLRMPVSHGVSAVSSRTAMNNGGY
ncbi:MAG TPA: hypothetical protein VFT30_06515, partial [Nitrospira sp.]|nr:hypothetical protein [Nitrospira sp.]